MTFRVEISAAAERDAEAILEWLLPNRLGTPAFDGSWNWNGRSSRLHPPPSDVRWRRENQRFPFEARQLLYGRKPHVYRILFTVEDETVHVLHLRHGRRQVL